MSRLDPSVITLDKGLNLQTAKILAPAGSALDSLNYEQVDFQGQKRIEGYTSYDGNILSAIDDYYIVNELDVRVNSQNLVFVGNSFLGKKVDDYLGDPVVAVYDFKLLDTITFTAGTAFDEADTHYNKLLQYNQYLRSLVEHLPGAIIGLHWLNDRLYAVADMATLELEGIDLGISIGEYLTNDQTEFSISRRILKVIEGVSTTVVFLEGLSIEDWLGTGATVVYKDTIPLQLVLNSEVSVEDYIASIFESRTEVQAITEDAENAYVDYGWKFKHLGWEVLFKDGSVPYGGLTALNQNRSGVGIQGPTSVTGNNGRPLSLVQKVNIVNEVVQVNGWKTSSTPTSYNLDPLALQEVDTSYIYADAYIEWDTDSGVTTPDATALDLRERPATSTVEVIL